MKKILLLFMLSFISSMMFFSCNNSPNDTELIEEEEKQSEDVEQEFIFFDPSLNHDYLEYQRTHTVYEYHCKDLGDSYYEVKTYIVHYFAASTGGNGATHSNNGAYRYYNENQLVDIIRQGNITPDFIEKRMTKNTNTKTITDYISKQSVVLYIPEKIKNEGHYYGITRK